VVKCVLSIAINSLCFSGESLKEVKEILKTPNDFKKTFSLRCSCTTSPVFVTIAVSPPPHALTPIPLIALCVTVEISLIFEKPISQYARNPSLILKLRLVISIKENLFIAKKIQKISPPTRAGRIASIL